MANDIQDVLKDFTLECFNGMDLYEVSQLSEDELKAQLKSYYESQLATITSEESSEDSTEATSSIAEAAGEEIADVLQKLTDYLHDMENGIEDAEDAGGWDAAVSATRDKGLLASLQEFHDTQGTELLAKTTEVVLPYLSHLSNTLVESEEDEYFSYDTHENNVIYGGEVIRYNLKASSSSLLTTSENYGDTDGDGQSDFDANMDGAVDLKDQIEEIGYDTNKQDIFVSLCDGDKINSLSWSNGVLSVEIETVSRTVSGANGDMELSPKTFMLEIAVDDPEAVNIILQGKDGYADPEVFADLPAEALNMIYDNESVEPLSQTLDPESLTPELDAQLAALPGYSNCISALASSVATMRSAFSESENKWPLPSDAESVLTELYTAIFDNESLNSYSEFTREEGQANFQAILDRYPAEQQSALVMTFYHNFIQVDPVQCEAVMYDFAAKSQDIINMGQPTEFEPDFVQKAIHTEIEETMGIGKYSGDGSAGTILSCGNVYATGVGTAGVLWKDHDSSAAALQFLIDNGFDQSGKMAQTLEYENSLANGQISTTAAANLQLQLSSLMSGSSEYKYWEGAALSRDEWDKAISYLKNHLITKDGALVDDPQQVFKNCMNRFFKKDGEWTNAADNFAASFLAACDVSGGDLSESLMQGKFGPDIAKYLWNICDNGHDEPLFYDIAKQYKNFIVKDA